MNFKTAIVRNKKGFSLIELIVVIAVIGILAGIIVLNLGSWRGKAYDASVKSDANSINAAEKQYILSSDTKGKAWDSTLGFDSDLKTSLAAGNIAKVTLDYRGYCVKVYNPNSSSYPNFNAAYSIESAKGSCTTDTFAVNLNSNSNLVHNAIAYASDGGYFTTGSTSVSPNPFVSKYDAVGQIVWTKVLSISGQARDIIRTSDSGFAITGYSGSSLFIAKFDSSGSLTWGKTASMTYGTYGNKIIQTSDGGYAVIGQTYNGFNTITLLNKYDSVGTLSWSRTFQSTSVVNNWGNSIAQKTDGSFIITGEDDAGALIASISSTGTVNWTKVWKENSMLNTRGNSVVINNDSTITIAGTYTSGYECDIIQEFIQKYDSSGNLLSTRSWGNGLNISNEGLILNSDGGYTTAGTFGDCSGTFSKTYLTKTDSTGNLQWSKYFGNENNLYYYGNGVSSALYGGYAVAATDATLSTVVLLKYDENGSIANCAVPATCGDIGLPTQIPAGTFAASQYNLLPTTQTPTVASYAPTISSQSNTSSYLINP